MQAENASQNRYQSERLKIHSWQQGAGSSPLIALINRIALRNYSVIFFFLEEK